MSGTKLKCNQCGKDFPADRYAEMAAHEKEHEEAARREWDRVKDIVFPKKNIKK